MNKENYSAIAEIIKKTTEDNNTDKPFCSKGSYNDVKEYIKIVAEDLANYFERENITPKKGDGEYWHRKAKQNFNKERFLKECGL